MKHRDRIRGIHLPEYFVNRCHEIGVIVLCGLHALNSLSTFILVICLVKLASRVLFCHPNNCNALLHKLNIGISVGGCVSVDKAWSWPFSKVCLRIVFSSSIINCLIRRRLNKTKLKCQSALMLLRFTLFWNMLLRNCCEHVLKSNVLLFFNMVSASLLDKCMYLSS